MVNLKKTVTGIFAAIQLASLAYASPMDNIKKFDSNTQSQIMTIQNKGKTENLQKDFAKLNQEFLSIKENILRWEAFSRSYTSRGEYTKVSYSNIKLKDIQESENKTVLEVLKQIKNLYVKYSDLAHKYNLNLEDILPNLEILSSTIVQLYIKAIDGIRLGSIAAMNIEGKSYSLPNSYLDEKLEICVETLNYLEKIYKITEDPAIKVAISNWKSFTQKLVSMKK